MSVKSFVKQYLISPFSKATRSTDYVHPSIMPSPKPHITSQDETYKPRAPSYSPVDIDNIVQTTPLLKGLFSVIEREIFDSEAAIVPMFMKKCPRCGVTYDNEFVTCENSKCYGAELVTPDCSQKAKLVEFMKAPNPNCSAETMLRGMLFNDLSQSNYFVSVGHKVSARFRGVQWVATSLYLEDPVLMRVVADDQLRIGDPNQLICIACNDGVVYGRDKNKYDSSLKSMGAEPNGEKFTIFKTEFLKGALNTKVRCPRCSGILAPTAFVKFKNKTSNVIEARYTTLDMRHGSFNLVPPALYGIPRFIVAWKLIQAVNAMDDVNRQTYVGKHLSALVNWKGMSQEEVNGILRKAREQGLNTLEYDPVTQSYVSSKGLTQIHLGSSEAGIQYINILDDFTKLQSLEFYNKYGDIIAMMYGVPPAFINWSESGGGSKDPSFQKDIILSGVRSEMNWLEDEWNHGILPFFGITDFGIKFASVSTREDFRRMQMEQIKANVYRLYAESGYDVYFDDMDGTFKIRGRLPEPLSAVAGKRIPESRQPRTKISESSDQLVEG